jgi:aryl-alcohol dehydrogenase-like predicted oxidoreductase
MKEQGMFRFLAVSSHNRKLFPSLARDDRYDLLHVRYNATHRGAEDEVFDQIDQGRRPGIVTYTATRWGDLLNPGKMPPGETPPRGADCYRFALSHPSVDVCMTGPRDRNQMREALAALELGPLNPEEMRRMKKIGDYVHTHHKRPFQG